MEAAILREKLKALAELQKVDLEVASLRKAADVHPRQLAELERELGAARSAIEAERTRVADIERQKTTLEQNISDEKDKVKKWEARLAEQRSTREYSALAREIDIAKKANQTMSDELVELTKTLGAARRSRASAPPWPRAWTPRCCAATRPSARRSCRRWWAWWPGPARAAT